MWSTGTYICTVVFLTSSDYYGMGKEREYRAYNTSTPNQVVTVVSYSMTWCWHPLVCSTDSSTIRMETTTTNNNTTPPNWGVKQDLGHFIRGVSYQPTTTHVCTPSNDRTYPSLFLCRDTPCHSCSCSCSFWLFVVGSFVRSFVHLFMHSCRLLSFMHAFLFFILEDRLLCNQRQFLQ